VRCLFGPPGLDAIKVTDDTMPKLDMDDEAVPREKAEQELLENVGNKDYEHEAHEMHPKTDVAEMRGSAVTTAPREYLQQELLVNVGDDVYEREAHVMQPTTETAVQRDSEINTQSEMVAQRAEGARIVKQATRDEGSETTREVSQSSANMTDADVTTDEHLEGDKASSHVTEHPQPRSAARCWWQYRVVSTKRVRILRRPDVTAEVVAHLATGAVFDVVMERKDSDGRKYWRLANGRGLVPECSRKDPRKVVVAAVEPEPGGPRSS
jgi:hypothetical protein